MANRRYTEFKERKVSDGGKYTQNAPSKGVSMKEKPAFPGASLPGKAQKGGRNLGVTKCRVYPKSEGL